MMSEEETSLREVESNESIETINSSSSQEQEEQHNDKEANDNGNDKVIITFASYVDLQTKLVLMPLNEEECLGAVVSSYSPNDASIAINNENNENNEDEEKKKECLDDNESNIEGYVLSAILNDNNEIDYDCMDADYTDIMTNIRASSSSITLSFTPQSSNDDNEPATSDNEEQQLNAAEVNQREVLVGRLSRWGSKLRTTSAMLAAETAIRASNLAEVATEQIAQQQALRSSPPPPSPPSPTETTKDTLFISIHKNNECLPISENDVITNCTVLNVLNNNNNIQWLSNDIPLNNATNASFQPSAIHLNTTISCNIDDENISTNVLVTPDATLQQAAECALVDNQEYKATFAGLLNDHNQLCAIFIYNNKLSIEHDEILHDIYSLQISVDPCHTRMLLFHDKEDDQVWKLYAPNRVARETILLTIRLIFDHSVFVPFIPVKEEKVASETTLENTTIEAQAKVIEETFNEGENFTESTIIEQMKRELQELKESNLKDKQEHAQVTNQYKEKLNKLQENNDTQAQTLDKNKTMITNYEQTIKQLTTNMQTLAKQNEEMEHVINKQESDIDTYQKEIEAINKEKYVIKASLESKEEKLNTMEEYKLKIKHLEDQMTDFSSLKKQLTQEKSKNETSNQAQTNLQTQITQFQNKIQSHQSTIKSLEQQITQNQNQIQLLKSNNISIQEKNHKLLSDRNFFKNKSESLSKEMKIHYNSKEDKLSKIRQEYEGKLHSEKKEKRKLQEELDCYVDLYQQSVIHEQQHEKESYSVHQLMKQKGELERVVRELTEYMQAKEMQLETLKEVNCVLTEEVRRLNGDDDGAV